MLCIKYNSSVVFMKVILLSDCAAEADGSEKRGVSV